MLIFNVNNFIFVVYSNIFTAVNVPKTHFSHTVHLCSPSAWNALFVSLSPASRWAQWALIGQLAHYIEQPPDWLKAFSSRCARAASQSDVIFWLRNSHDLTISRTDGARVSRSLLLAALQLMTTSAANRTVLGLKNIAWQYSFFSLQSSNFAM